jgi:hypothetical protein
VSDLFTQPALITAVTRARSSDVNTLETAVAAAFTKLPNEAEVKQSTANYAAGTGVVNAYVVTLPYPPTSYTDGMEVCFKPSISNSGASTINVNALGAKTIVNPDGSVLSAGAIPINGFSVIRYNATTGLFVLINPATMVQGGSGYATLNGNEVLSNKTLSSPVINNATFNGATFATQAPNDNTTKAATTAYVDAADALKAPLASPVFTGTPAAPTPAPNNNSTRIPTTAYVDAADALKAPLASPVFSGIVSDAAGGLRDIPQNSQDTAYQLVLGDAGKHILKPASTARTYTVPANATVAFPLGTAVTFVNLGGTTNNVTVARAGGVSIYRAGTNADITITPGDMVTIVKVGTDIWQA